MHKFLLPLFAAMMGVGAAPAHAGFISAYTDIDLDLCLVLDADDFRVNWACPGYKGYPLMVRQADLRFSLGYGFNIAAEPKLFQTLPPINHLGAKLEWRLSNALGRWLPIATIAPYVLGDTQEGEESKQALVVTQLVEGNICHIAYIDARANPDALELARAAADSSGSFDCAKDKPKTIGKFAAW